jgi:hypothetical protein
VHPRRLDGQNLAVATKHELFLPRAQNRSGFCIGKPACFAHYIHNSF